MPRFMLIFQADDVKMTSFTTDEYRQHIDKFRAWAARLSEDGAFLGGMKLKNESTTIVRNGADGPVIDGPYTETKEAVGGYFEVQAHSPEAAAEIAKECPIFDIDGAVIVREIDDEA